MSFYGWLVLTHVIGAFLFVLFHGASAGVVLRIRRETDIVRIRSLLDLSGSMIIVFYVALLLMLVGGIWAGLEGSWFTNGRLWILGSHRGPRRGRRRDVRPDLTALLRVAQVARGRPDRRGSDGRHRGPKPAAAVGRRHRPGRPDRAHLVDGRQAVLTSTGIMGGSSDPRPYLRLFQRNPAFTRLYAAQLISFAGDWFATVGLLGLALELTGSTAVASLVLVLQTGPFFLASPYAGHLGRSTRSPAPARGVGPRAGRDRAGIPARSRDASTLWIALVCVALLSVGSAFFEPTSSASLPNLVEKDDLPVANALIGAAWGTMLAVGAALGGLVAAVAGRDAAFVDQRRQLCIVRVAHRRYPPLLPRTCRAG